MGVSGSQTLEQGAASQEDMNIEAIFQKQIDKKVRRNAKMLRNRKIFENQKFDYQIREKDAYQSKYANTKNGIPNFAQLGAESQENCNPNMRATSKDENTPIDDLFVRGLESGDTQLSWTRFTPTEFRMFFGADTCQDDDTYYDFGQNFFDLEEDEGLDYNTKNKFNRRRSTGNFGRYDINELSPGKSEKAANDDNKITHEDFEENVTQRCDYDGRDFTFIVHNQDYCEQSRHLSMSDIDTSDSIGECGPKSPHNLKPVYPFLKHKELDDKLESDMANYQTAATRKQCMTPDSRDSKITSCS